MKATFASTKKKQMQKKTININGLSNTCQPHILWCAMRLNLLTRVDSVRVVRIEYEMKVICFSVTNTNVRLTLFDARLM